ncbi:MAG: hypothetical protein EBR09_15910, partial [Proteobacteria bacterium]|nr:hypothetical protein [Pseudomonadota bacterium]
RWKPFFSKTEKIFFAAEIIEFFTKIRRVSGMIEGAGGCSFFGRPELERSQKSSLKCSPCRNN